jgi:hypothetical protein
MRRSSSGMERNDLEARTRSTNVEGRRSTKNRAGMLNYIFRFVRRLVGTFSLRVGHASSAAGLKAKLAKCAPSPG